MIMPYDPERERQDKLHLEDQRRAAEEKARKAAAEAALKMTIGGKPGSK